jgi:magnesium-transporting ATPase (P-type)
MWKAAAILFAAAILVLGLGWEGPTAALLAQPVEQPDSLPEIDFPTDFDTEIGMGGGEEVPTSVFVALGVFGFIVLAVLLALLIFVYYLLYTCLKRIPQQYRLMEPGLVFLLLIPCFNLVWIFFVTSRISRSLQAYFASQGRTDVGDCGQQLGLWWSICVVAGMVPLLNYIAGPASLVLMIIYLVKVVGLKNQIAEGAIA